MSGTADKQPKLTAKEKYGYSVGSMGEGMAYNLVSSFFMVYCTDVLGVTAGFMGGLFFFGRLWDAANDPIMGMLGENVNTRWGKHRPWILLGGVANAVVLMFLFNPTLARAGNVHVYICVFYILCDMTYTIIDVPYYAYAAAFGDPRERDQISTMPRILGGAGTIGIPALTLTMVSKLSPKSQGQGFFRWSVIIAVFFIICAFISAFSMKDRRLAVTEKKYTVADAFKTLKNNEQVLIIEVVFILAFTAVFMTTSVAVYYFKYVWGKPEVFGIFTVVAGAGMGASLLAYPLLVKRFTRRQIFIFSLSLPVSGYLLMFILAFTAKSVYALMPAALLLVSGFGCVSILSSVFMADTVDYGEWKLGYRSESLIFSLLTLLGKFAAAISGLLSGLGMQLGGYIPTDESLADSAAVITAQPETVATALNILMFAIPPGILIAALIIYLKKYKLHGEFLEKISTELKERRILVNE